MKININFDSDFQNIIERLNDGEKAREIFVEYQKQFREMDDLGYFPAYSMLGMRISYNPYNGPLNLVHGNISIDVSLPFDGDGESRVCTVKILTSEIHLTDGLQLIIIEIGDPKEIADEIRRKLMDLSKPPEPPELDPQSTESIALEPFSMDTSDYVKLACGHIFNTEYEAWLRENGECPMCRRRVQISTSEIKPVFKFDSIDDLEEVQKIAKVTPEVTSDKTYYIMELTESARVNLRQKGLQIVLKNDNLSIVRSQTSSAKKAKIQILMDQDIVDDVRRALGDVVKQDSDNYYLQVSDTNELRDSLLEKGLRIISTDDILYIVRINADNTPAFLGLKLRF